MGVRAADVAVALVLATTATLAARETVARLAPDAPASARLPDADDVEEETVAALDRAVTRRPRDPRLLVRAARARGPEDEGEALRLFVRAATVAPYAGHLGSSVAARLLEEGRARVVEAAWWRERARRAVASRAAGSDEVETEARRHRSRARWTLETVLDLDRAIAPRATGRADLSTAALEARALLADLGDAP